MLYIIRMYGHGISIPHDKYNFYWHSGGRAHHWFIFSDSHIEFWRNKTKTLEKLPTDVKEFFGILKKFIDLEYREINNVIEIATPRPGKLIGKNGRNIREIKKHLNRDIKVVESWAVLYADCDNYNSVLQLPDKTKIVLQKEEVEELKPFHVIIRNGKYSIGYLAPWKHMWLLDRTNKVRHYVQRYKCGHIKNKWSNTVNISRKLEPMTIEYTWYELCPKCKVLRR